MKLPFRARALACAAVLALAATAAPLPALAQLAPIVAAAANAPVDQTGAVTVEVVAGVASQKTYVTFAHIEADGTGTIQFKYGNAGCGSGLVAAYGRAISLTAQTGFYGGGGIGPVIVVPLGKSLCLITTGAGVNFSGWLTQAQFPA